ncbi:GNAT family N-acetyltransferase [Profundibacterium mesophilum]|uniref:L-ornithine N(alpha)-acyltransferase n=1 Tax=Profundibacterium mesophilum KAUST100406-0324 TaxID=1037889 RepID=A0A921NQ18_9RHOB|nr:GNAT family N-acyltransferase [Profundibacterium mesophilum]KAF0675185.1 Ornithine-acylacyl carrier protein N-acyltransferase [Profundibacterium mesophilum KAUST100406-0324]
MSRIEPRFSLRLASCEDDLLRAQRLRYEVFVAELGGDGPMVDHSQRRETDAFDPFYDHLLLCDDARPEEERVIGAYRLLRSDSAAAVGGFYGAAEYDLAPLMRSGRKLLELGRSCLHPDYRGGSAMHHLWSGLADYVRRHEIEVLFGVASFHGTRIAALAQPLSFLHHRYLAPEEIRPVSRRFEPMDLVADDAIDRLAAIRGIPSLIKAYLRLGGHVGHGAYLDTAFNTTDVCLVLDTARMNPKLATLYGRGVV